jgi:serine/threonine-protein kinase
MKHGQIIGSRYCIKELLGQGGTSAVYLAENVILKNLWAIKALSKLSPYYMYELQEIELLKCLSHPMLPRIVDLFEDETHYYIVMDYISGMNLLSYLEAHGKVPEEKLFQWTRELLGILAYLHGRNPPVIYRDLKPSNLILDNEGHLRLIDFGTARLHREGITEDTVYIGTQGYAAPEQYGSGQSDARTDLFNLGMTLFHLATGVHPLKLDNAPLSTVLKRSGISSTMTRLILDLVHTDPDKRIQSAQDALMRLDKASTVRSLLSIPQQKTGMRHFSGVIALASVMPHTGLTSLALMLALFFKRQGYRTALAEVNPSGDLNRLKDALHQAGKIKTMGDDFFEAEGITFFTEVQDSGMLSKKGLDIILLDLGELRHERLLRELNHGNIKMILCPNAPWKLDSILSFQERFESFNRDEWVYVLYGAHKHEFLTIKQFVPITPLVLFPSFRTPFTLSREDEHQIRQAMKQVFAYNGHHVRL